MTDKTEDRGKSLDLDAGACVKNRWHVACEALPFFVHLVGEVDHGGRKKRGVHFARLDGKGKSARDKTVDAPRFFELH